MAGGGGEPGILFVGEPSDVFGGAITVLIPAHLLTALANQEGVRYARLRLPPRAGQGASLPTVLFPNGPADRMGATAWHNDGCTGDGVKVGIIDNAFNGFTVRVAPQLKTPAKFLCHKQSTGQVSHHPFDCQGFWSFEDHGTRVAEYLLSVAPDVSLYLTNFTAGGGSKSMNEAVLWMIDNGVQVINMSLGATWHGPGDGTTPFPDSDLRTIALQWPTASPSSPLRGIRTAILGTPQSRLP